jgi:hypothetical protein
MIKTIYNLVRDGWKSINIEQKLSLAGIVIGMIIIDYAFCYAFHNKYGWIIAAFGYTLAMFCSLGYALFKYFPILKQSKQRIPQKTISDYVR